MSLTQLTRHFEVCGGVCSSSVCLRACVGGGGGATPYWPTLPVSREINTTPGVPGISRKLPEKSQFRLMQDFPENSMDST